MHLSILWQFCGIFVDCPWLSIPPRSQPPVPSWCLSSFAFLQLPDILSLRCSCCRIYPNAIDDLHLYWATLAWDRTSSPNRHAFGRVKSACWQWQSRLLKKCQKALPRCCHADISSRNKAVGLAERWIGIAMNWGPCNFQGNMGCGSTHQAD